MQLRKALSPEKATPTPTPSTATDVDKGDEENEDDKLLNEMEELTYAMERKKKREKKILAKRRAKVYSLLEKSSYLHDKIMKWIEFCVYANDFVST